MLPRSRFYAPYAVQPHAALPLMDKARWMANFDTINTIGARREQALAIAERAETSRDFAPTLANGVAVGLSTGTSGQRGLFLVSPQERRRWAGVMIAKLLPVRPLRARRVAFFLRANSRLYQSAEQSRRIAFHFFDMLEPLDAALPRLGALAPHILIAPASVLRLLAEAQTGGRVRLAPERVISIAETLHDDDRAAIAAAFGAPLGEVYQATEGALAMTCERGALHLNEAFVLFEQDWLDDTRFAPIVSDLTRATQPVLRYRLDDVLRIAPTPCPCGRASRTIAAIEGRCDDICTFVSASGAPVRVFPDFIARAVLGADNAVQDFRVVQDAPATLTISLKGGDEARVRAALNTLAATLGAKAPAITFTAYGEDDGPKRRRVRARVT